MKLLNSSSSHGWVEACANGQVGCMGGFAKVDNVFGWMSCVQGGSIVVFSSLTIHRFSLFFHDMIS